MVVLNISVFVNVGTEYLIYNDSCLGEVCTPLHTLTMKNLLWMRLCSFYCATISAGNIDSGTCMY